ncbi:MAG: hypothetical protein HY912_15720 [Desulfomonile tiedjei]|uniref:Uncharacterized protein n=1 Tax=Desulfomonile tiedjei TaxID=2358 RepID=A0A9D6Z7B0_9BACT|nr:hypothetical protein [Desulfomonile tiedjei]
MSGANTPRSWNTHALLTRAALRSVFEPRLEETVEVVGIEEFLLRANRDFLEIIEEYNRRIGLHAGMPFKTSSSESHMATSDQFLTALKLNPSIAFNYVRALSPDEIPPETPHDPSRNGPPGGMYVPLPEGEATTGSEVLITFSDEPDWGMDQDLYPIREYGYGQAPFGQETGKTSQAPFHMTFLHENPIVTTIIPDIRKSFMEERIRVFFALARTAFAHGVNYWGWRFTAWAMHYLQDLTQPYHAKPYPPALAPVWRRLAMSRDLRGFIAKLGNYLKNHHLLFEAAVHFIINEVAKKPQDHPFLRALEGSGKTGQKLLVKVMHDSSRFPARIATTVDREMTNVMNVPRIEDIDYSLEDDSAYRIAPEIVKAAQKRPEQLDRFIHIVSDCLLETGNVTRYAIQIATCSNSKGEKFL